MAAAIGIAGLLAVFDAVIGDSAPTMMKLVWTFNAAWAAVAVICLLFVAVAWLLYRRAARSPRRHTEVVGRP
ncbi:hypothetical protein [Micromonospora aurantiaca (nom. illeg.)]|uniref:hypothetical protein n=1 Tax=Micromonospora aurantiaca (nom. illeg.) TaxID=47850 RepID=UPI0033C907CC